MCASACVCVWCVSVCVCESANDWRRANVLDQCARIYKLKSIQHFYCFCTKICWHVYCIWREIVVYLFCLQNKWKQKKYNLQYRRIQVEVTLILFDCTQVSYMSSFIFAVMCSCISYFNVEKTFCLQCITNWHLFLIMVNQC